jgi:hypothetical protein
MEVGDDQAVGRHKETRADGRLGVGVAQQRADLHQLVAREFINAPGVARQRRSRHRWGHWRDARCGRRNVLRAPRRAGHSRRRSTPRGDYGRRANGRRTRSAGVRWGLGICQAAGQQKKWGDKPKRPAGGERHCGILRRRCGRASTRLRVLRHGSSTCRHGTQLPRQIVLNRTIENFALAPHHIETGPSEILNEIGL